MGIFPHSDRLISSKGGGNYIESRRNRVSKGNVRFEFPRIPSWKFVLALHVFFQLVAKTTCTRVYARKRSVPPSQRPSIFSHWSNGMPMQVSSKQFLIFLFRLPDGAFLLREIVRIKT